MTVEDYLKAVRTRLNARGHHGANVYEIGSVQASTDLARMADMLEVCLESLAPVVECGNCGELGTTHATL